MSDITDKVHDKDAEIEEDESSEADAGEQVDSDEYDDNEYCICRGHDDGTFMIQCDRCTEWYHGKCIQVTPRKVKEVARWVCPLCEAKLNAGLTPTVVTHAHKKQNGAQHKASAQPRTRGDDDNPRKRKRDDEQGASGPDVKRAKSEHKSGEHKSHEHKNQEQKSADRNESKASALRTSKENALKTSKEGRAALKKSDKPRSSQTHSPPPLRYSAGTSEAQWQQQREGVRSKLVAMLQRVSSDAQTPSSDGSDARLQEIAREIEETLVEHVPRAQYLSKFRALMLSLPKNSELCSDVLRGVVSGSALVRMDEEHWAPKALQDLRAKYQHYLPVKPTEDEALATASPTGTVPPPPTTSATHDGEQRATGGDGDEKSSSERRDDRSESAAHDEVSRDAVSRDSPPINTSEHKNHVIEQQTPPGSPYQALDESDSEHVTGPNVALDDIEIDVKIDERSLEPIEFTEPAPEPVPEPVPASEPQSADLYDPDTSANEDVEPVMEVEHVEPSEYVDQIWKGMLTYQKLIPDVALRSVHLEGAKVEHLIGEELVIDGRMDLRKLVDYLPQIDFSQSRQRSTLLFKAEVGYDEYYHRMYEHLMSINRGGVIRVDEQTCSTELFKEIYLVPVLKHAPPAFIAPALKALVDSPAYRHLIGQTDELLLGVFLTRRADLAALPARPPRTPKLTPTPEVHVPPPQSHPASKPHPNPSPEVPKSVPSVRPPAGQPPNVLPGVSLPPNPNLPNPNAFLPPQLQSLLSNLIGQALGPASGSVPNPPFNPNPAPYAPQQNRGYPAQNYSAEPYEDYRGDYDEYGQQHRDAYQHQQQQHDYHSEYQHRDAYQQQQHGNNNASDYGGGHQSGDYDNYRGGYQDNNGYNHGGNYNNNNRFRGGHNNYHNNNRRGGGGFRSGGGRFRSNQRGRRF